MLRDYNPSYACAISCRNTHPNLIQLICKGFHFNWGPEHTEAFTTTKRELTLPPVLSYYDPNKPLVLQTDACIKGLGAVLLQDKKPVCFASKALQPCERKYVSMELEALAVRWPVEKFHHYLYGQQFTLETVQKPLVSILSKGLLKASPQMQWLLMKIVPYNMNVKYIPSQDNTIADCLSRAPIKADTIQLTILQVHQITNNCECTADKLQQLHKKQPKMITWYSPNILCNQVGPKKFKICHWSSTSTGHFVKSLPLRIA